MDKMIIEVSMIRVHPYFKWEGITSDNRQFILPFKVTLNEDEIIEKCRLYYPNYKWILKNEL